ncbi:hypothetical protein EDB89DRAFT_2076703 [Lactarius sanguifluus]|nr:hypothetical protein EDB89DRAFT_2076703 [Lactarius sanguifluus]
MTEMIRVVKIMVEVLWILGISTKETKQGRTRAYLKKLVGWMELEDALKCLDKLTQDEARMAAAHLLKIGHNVETQIAQVIDGSQRQGLRKWVSTGSGSDSLKEVQSRNGSPPVPNCGSTGSVRTFFLLQLGIPISCPFRSLLDHNDISLRKAGLASEAQLSAQSDLCCEILLHVAHDNGTHKPSDDVLARCLKEMLALLVQSPTYLIVDALDECPKPSEIPSARERVIELVKELLGPRLPNIRISITSRLEIDVKAGLGLLASHYVHEVVGEGYCRLHQIRRILGLGYGDK